MTEWLHESRKSDNDSGRRSPATIARLAWRTTFFRYKSTIGDRIRARYSRAQKTEAVLGCNVLNQMPDLGRQESYAIGA